MFSPGFCFFLALKGCRRLTVFSLCCISAHAVFREEAWELVIDYVLFLLAPLQTGDFIGYIVRGPLSVFDFEVIFH